MSHPPVNATASEQPKPDDCNLREYRTTDKTGWGDGPWMHEPDKRQWTDAATRLPCLIVRGPSGALCGYVGVAAGHPFFEREYNDVDVDVHGGLTFAETCADGPDPSTGVCHLAAPGEPDHVWWLGFDSAHAFDLAPAFHSILGASRDRKELYRDLSFVRTEVERLAQQIAAAATDAGR